MSEAAPNRASFTSGASRLIAVAAANDAVAWAEGNESEEGSATDGRQSVQLRTRSLDDQLDQEVESDREGADHRGGEPLLSPFAVDGCPGQTETEPEIGVRPDFEIRWAVFSTAGAWPRRMKRSTFLSSSITVRAGYGAIRHDRGVDRPQPTTEQEFKREFRRSGLPLLAEGYSASEDIFNRAAPLLGVVLVLEVLGPLN